VCAVLSGNRNFEGRIQQEVRRTTSRPAAGRRNALAADRSRPDNRGPGTARRIYLRDIAPSAREVDDLVPRRPIKGRRLCPKHNEVLHGGRAVAGFRSRGRSVRLEPEFDRTSAGAVLRRHCPGRRAGHRTSAGRGCVPSGRQHHHRSHLAAGSIRKTSPAAST